MDEERPAIEKINDIIMAEFNKCANMIADARYYKKPIEKDPNITIDSLKQLRYIFDITHTYYPVIWGRDECDACIHLLGVHVMPLMDYIDAVSIEYMKEIGKMELP